MQHDVLEAARDFLARDIYSIPIRPRSKCPAIADWTNARLGLDDLSEHFSNGHGLGVLLGIQPRVIGDVDLDCIEALAVRPLITGPVTERIFGRKSKPLSHFLYELPEPFDRVYFEDPVLKKQDPHAKATLIELRGQGGQTVVPPSVHESGEQITWERAGEFGKTTLAALHAWVAKIAAAALLVRYWPRGHETRHALAGMLGRAGWDKEAAAEFVLAVLRAAQPDTRRGEVRADVRACYDRLEQDQDVFGKPKLIELLGEHGPLIVRTVILWLNIQHDEFPSTDGANADRFAEQHAADVRYCKDRRIWFAWTGKRWEPDALGEVMQLGRETALSIHLDARKTKDEDQRKKRMKWAAYADSRYGLEAMTSLARWHPAILVKSFDATFDPDPLLFNCANGIIDLRTGELGPHRRDAMMTKMSPVAYDPTHAIKKFDAFIVRTFSSDPAMVGFMQRFCGYCLTGLTGEIAFFLAYGESGAAKSTWVRLLHGILGDYAVAIPGRALLAKKPGQKDYDTYILAGARLATTVETTAGRRLDEETIKAITGQDILHGERKYENVFAFRSKAKLLMATNHRPTVRDTDDAIWKRIKPIKFAAKVSDSEKIDKIEEVLIAEEGPGVLAWFVKGCLEWQEKKGLIYPENITNDAKSYRKEQDEVQTFIAEACVIGKEEKVSAHDLYVGYVKWSKESGVAYPVSKTRFGKELDRLGYMSDRTGGASHWLGLRLKLMGE